MSKATPEEIAALLAVGGLQITEQRPAAPAPAAPERPPAPEKAPEPAPDPVRENLLAAAKHGKIGYSAGNPIAFDFSTPGEMFLYFHPNLTPHEWQLEEQHRIGGYLNLEHPDKCESAKPTQERPFYYNLVAANGSGKDTYIISPAALWFISSRIRSRVIITSASQDQLKLQTFNYITSYAKRVNAQLGYEVYDIKEFHIYNNLTGGELVGRVTNDAGKAEGFHPFPEYPGAEMMVIVNEAKSITDEIFASFSRFTGYNYWLQISSPGIKSGQFYRTTQNASQDRCELGRQFMRRVTAFECPNISRAHIEQVRLIHGEDSLIYRTSILAEFFSSDLDVIIPETVYDYPPPANDTFGLEPAAGLDLAFSQDGDGTHFCIWWGNHEVYKSNVATDSADKIHSWIIEQIEIGKKRFGLKPEHVYVDGGGLGKPIISRIVEAGYAVTTRKNEYAPMDKLYYTNLGAELWFRVKRLFQQRVLVQPEDQLARKQLTERKAILLEQTQKYRLEGKLAHRARLRYSPDRADAIVLALSGYPLDVLLSRPPKPACGTLKGRETEADMQRMLANYAFNQVAIQRLGTASSARGNNHELLMKYGR